LDPYKGRDVLYPGFPGPRLNQTEAYLVVSNTHSGAYGSHRAGMYWPSMLRECIDFAKGRQECQVHARIQHVPASEFHSIVKPCPFRGWTLDIIGEIKPNSSKGHRYILVGINYFTKWVEVIPLPDVNQEVVISFIQVERWYNLPIRQDLNY